FAPHPECGTGLRSLRHLEFVLAVQCWDDDLSPQCRLRERYRHRAIEVLAVTLEEWMRLHVKHDIEIAGWGANPSGIALLLITNARAVFHSGRNCNVDGAFVHHASIALALVAWIGNNAAHSLTCGTGAGDGEEALLIPDLASAAAGGTGG